MRFPTINLIHALTLMSISLWMYKSSVNPAIVHLFPFLAGIILLTLNNGIKEGSKEQKRAAFYLTLIVFIYMVYLLLFPNELSEEGFTINIAFILVVSMASGLTYLYESYRQKTTTK
ncbi:MAG: hypothetical protein WAT79_14595 [Saprospiraceae bacterium]